jgi:phosphatidylglycerophosphatase C
VLGAAALVGPPWRLSAEVHRRDDVKAKLLRRLVRGFDAAEFAALGEEYAATLRAALDPAMAERLSEHRRRGHEIVLVSASLAAYLEPFGREELGIDHVIAVELEVDHEGRLTGEMTGPNVRGQEKVARLSAWLGERESVELWAYGNSSGDEELIALADHATWVGRRARP